MLTVIDASTGVDAPGITKSVTVNDYPVVNPITGITTLCKGSTQNLTSTTPGGAWTSGSGAASIDAAGLLTGVSAGSSLISYAVTASGCTTSVTTTATVNPLPDIVSVPSAAPAVCRGDLSFDVTFGTINNPDQYSITWSAAALAQGLSPVTNAPYAPSPGTITVQITSTAAVGTYTGTLSFLISSTGCSTSGSAFFTVNPLPTVSVVTPSPVCAPGTINLTAAAITSGSTAGLTYTQWTDLGATSALANPTNVSSSGTYYIKGVIPATGCADVQPVTATVNPSPTVNITNPSAVCLPNTIDLTAAGITTGSSPTATFTQWTDASASVALANANAVSASGTYYIKGTLPVTGCAVIQPVTATINPVPNVSITNPGAVCSPATIDLTSTAVTAGSSPTTTFTQWTDNLATAPLANPNAVASGGTYYIKGTLPVTGCSTIQPVIATVNPLPTVNITDPAAVCSPATIDLTATAITAGSSPTTIFSQWTDNTATSALANANAVTSTGTYYIKGTLPVTGCAVILPVTATINAQPTVNISNPAAVCSPGTIDLTATAVTAGSSSTTIFTQWTDNSATTALINPNAVASSGTYYIKGTLPVTGCETIQPVIATINPLPTVNVTNPASVCSPAIIDLTAAAITAGSSPTATFTHWTDNLATAALVNANAVPSSGTYYIKGTLPVTGCAVIQQVTVTINPQPTVNITNPAAVCSPAAIDLTATAITSGSSPTATFTQWTDNSATVALANPSAVSSSGTYYIKGTLPLTGCVSIQPVVATINPLPTVNITNPAAVCSPNTIDLTASAITAGSSPSATFTQWTDIGATSALLNPNAVSSSGTYYIKATLPVTGCAAIRSVTATINPLPTVNVANPAAVCSPNTVDLSAAAITAGSTAGLTFTQWANSNATISLASPSAITTSGTYYIKGTLSATNCAVIQAVVATINPLPLVSITNPAAACSPNTIDLTSPAITAGSTAGLTFSRWTDPAATNPLANPGAVSVSGTYYVKGVDPGTTCSTIRPVSATIYPRPTVVINNPSPVCFPNTVDLTAAGITSGSNAGLSFSYWSDISATQSLNNANSIAVSGTFYIKGTNNTTGCSQISAVNVVINQPPNAPTITGANAFCSGNSTTLSSSTSPGGYLWNNGQTTQSINVNAGGSFSVTIIDGNGCSATSAVKTVTANPPPTTPTITGSNSFCAGSNTTLTSSNSTNGYLWSTGAITPSINVSTAGNYSVIVTDLNGCTASSSVKTVSVNAVPATPVISGNAAFCVGGSTTLSVSPSPNSYLWSNGQTGQSINVSSAGSYTVTVTDVNGCAATSTAKVVTTNPAPTTPTISGVTTFCAGGSTTLTSSLSPGTYSWSNGQTTQSITVSTAGTVSVTVRDANGCSATSAAKNIVVNAPPATPVIAGNNAICAGSNTTLSSNAATGNSWSTGSALQTIQVSTAGNYSVTVTDVNGCTATSQPFAVAVNPLPQQPVISGNNAFCAGSFTTLTSTTANGYRWNTGATTRSINVSNAGSYSVTITDANGCTATSPASTVVVNPLPVLRINNPLAVCAPATVDITNASITAGSTPGISLSYFSNAAASNALAVPSAVAVSGTYYIRGLIAQTGCSAVAPVNVAINAAPVLNISNPPAVCAPATVDLTAASIVNGSAAGLNYSYWTDAATTKTLTSPSAVAVSGLYYIKAIAAGGCSASLPVVVTVGTRPVGALNNPAVNFICEGTVLQLTTQSNAARYQWFKDQSAIFNATGSTYDAAASGNYTVEFISQEGCITEAGNTIRLDLIQKPSLQFASTPGCEGTATSFVNQSTAATSGGISWLWNFGDGSSSNTFSASHVYAAGGQYMVTLTANNASCPSLTDTRQSLVVIPVAQAGTRYSTINAIAKQPFTLSARSFGAAYNWQPVFGLSQPTNQVTTAVLNADTTYTVRITTTAGCVTTDTVSVKVTLLGEIYVPQAFSPNGDGQNDRLYPNLVAIVKLNYFRIFNRWGNLVFQSADPTPANGWDGKLGGIAQAPGTFTWVAEGVDGAGNIIRRSGSTVLIK